MRLHAKLADMLTKDELVGQAHRLAASVFNAWRKDLKPPAQFSHPDGARFHQMLREAFENEFGSGQVSEADMSETRRFTAEQFDDQAKHPDHYRAHEVAAMHLQAAEAERVLARLREWVSDYSGAGGENMGVHAAVAEVRAILGRVKP